MLNLGVIDILLLVLLLSVFFYSARRHELFPFYVTLVIVALIEIERLIPGTLNLIGNVIRGIDAVNATLPHISIQPIVTISH